MGGIKGGVLGKKKRQVEWGRVIIRTQPRMERLLYSCAYFLFFFFFLKKVKEKKKKIKLYSPQKDMNKRRRKISDRDASVNFLRLMDAKNSNK